MPTTLWGESADCDGHGEEIWSVEQGNATTQTHLYYSTKMGNDPGAGEYYGIATFEQDEAICHFRYEAVYTGEDITVDTKGVTCLPFEDLAARAFGFAKMIAVDIGDDVDMRCMGRGSNTFTERGWGAFGQIHYNITLGGYDEESDYCGDAHYSVDVYFDVEGGFIAATFFDA